VEAAERIARDVLAPTAEATDRAPVVPAGHLEALAGAGLFGLLGPRAAGGSAAPAHVARQVYETLAGACGVTFFVWVQHHAPVRLLAGCANAVLRDRWLGPLCRGDVLGGIAFAYLRRPGPPAVVGRRVAGGWVVEGEAPFVTSWGLARLFAVAARAGDDIVYFALDTDRTGPSVRASAPLALAAMGASATVRLHLDKLFVPDEQVISTEPFGHWIERDQEASSRPHPAPFGVTATALRHLARQFERTGQTAIATTTASLQTQLDACRRRSYALLGETGSPGDRDGGAGIDRDERLARLVDARAEALHLALRAAAALVAATGGSALDLSCPAQRLLREAGFWSIQAQTGPVREATLARLVRQGR
jgi:alkylation response protein AidB-like acyl-CoA dehydrogenase